jgi:hypothetical protein
MSLLKQLKAWRVGLLASPQEPVITRLEMVDVFEKMVKEAAATIVDGDIRNWEPFIYTLRSSAKVLREESYLNRAYKLEKIADGLEEVFGAVGNEKKMSIKERLKRLAFQVDYFDSDQVVMVVTLTDVEELLDEATDTFPNSDLPNYENDDWPSNYLDDIRIWKTKVFGAGSGSVERVRPVCENHSWTRIAESSWFCSVCGVEKEKPVAQAREEKPSGEKK